MERFSWAEAIFSFSVNRLRNATLEPIFEAGDSRLVAEVCCDILLQFVAICGMNGSIDGAWWFMEGEVFRLQVEHQCHVIWTWEKAVFTMELII